MATIDVLAGDHARKRRTVAEHLQLAHGLARMADDVLSDLQATTHELTLCAALSGASQAHASLASAMMLEQQARLWELQAHPPRTVDDDAAAEPAQQPAAGGGSSDSEPLTFRPGIDGVAAPVKAVPAKAARAKPARGAVSAGAARRRG